MTSFYILMVILGAVLSPVLGGEAGCDEKGDDAVIFTEKDQTWYYCQTSLLGRTSENCYVTFTKQEKDNTEADVHHYDLQTKSDGNDKFMMKYLPQGRYNYGARSTTSVILKVSPDGQCFTYWKCAEKNADWNGVFGNNAYLMFACNKPDLCKPAAEYQGDYKKILDEAVEAKKVKLSDVNQKECDKLGIRPK